MALTFVDVLGNEGQIRDDFEVDYDGPEPVREYVGEVTEETDSEGQAVSVLIAGLPEDLDIKSVEMSG